VHDIKELDIDPTKRVSTSVAGHSHKPAIIRREGVLFLNPGSAGRALPSSRRARPSGIGATLRARIVELRPNP